MLLPHAPDAATAGLLEHCDLLAAAITTSPRHADSNAFAVTHGRTVLHVLDTLAALLTKVIPALVWELRPRTDAPHGPTHAADALCTLSKMTLRLVQMATGGLRQLGAGQVVRPVLGRVDTAHNSSTPDLLL